MRLLLLIAYCLLMAACHRPTDDLANVETVQRPACILNFTAKVNGGFSAEIVGEPTTCAVERAAYVEDGEPLNFPGANRCFRKLIAGHQLNFTDAARSDLQIVDAKRQIRQFSPAVDMMRANEAVKVLGRRIWDVQPLQFHREA